MPLHWRTQVWRARLLSRMYALSSASIVVFMFHLEFSWTILRPFKLNFTDSFWDKKIINIQQWHAYEIVDDICMFAFF